MQRSLGFALALGLMLASFAGPASAKDLDAIKFVYLAPVITEEDVPAFQAMLKSELVHEGFTVLPKPDKADATLTVELVLTKKGDVYEIEAHAKLEESDFNVLWTGSYTKTDKDRDKLIINAAQKVIGKLKTAKVDIITKKEDKNNKESKQPR